MNICHAKGDFQEPYIHLNCEQNFLLHTFEHSVTIVFFKTSLILYHNGEMKRDG
jgi:hypothetical protein